MNYNNTHKMQCVDAKIDKKMTGNGSHRMIIIRHILDQVTSTIKIRTANIKNLD